MSEPTETIDAKISYKQAADYWSNVDPTVDGMLGGFGKISQIDIEGSSKFLKALFKVLLYHPRLISKWRCRISFSSVDILYSDSYYPCNVLYISKLIFLFKEQIIYKWNGFYFQSIRLLVLFFLSWSFHCLPFFQMTGGPGNQRALDCGAGIGRITKHLLQRHFMQIDLAEQNPKFLEKAKGYLQDSGKVGQLFCSGIWIDKVWKNEKDYGLFKQ